MARTRRLSRWGDAAALPDGTRLLRRSGLQYREDLRPTTAFHARPIPVPQPENLSIKLIREALHPCGQFLPQECVEDVLQSGFCSLVLIASSLIDKSNNPDARECSD